MKKNTIISVENLSISFKAAYETIDAVKDVSFSVDRGESLAIVGESGSGKTVSSLAIMGLLPSAKTLIRQGHIWWNDRSLDLLKLKRHQYRLFRGKKIAMIFQEPMSSLNPVQTCGWQVTEMILQHQAQKQSSAGGFKAAFIKTILMLPFLGQLYRLFTGHKLLTAREKKARKDALELFHRVELPRPEQILDAYPHELSGGQKQRVMIAMAMACNPEVLIADEPTTALDVTVQKNILLLLDKLRREQDMALIFITHDLGVVSQIADKTVVMYKGKIVEQGLTSQLFDRPSHPYTKGLIACRPRLGHFPRRLPTVSDFMEIDTDGELVVREGQGHSRETKQRNRYQERILQVEGLKTYFTLEKNWKGKITQEVRAVDNVSFDVFKGETLGIVGESGCGKSTLGRTILGLIKATDGKITYKGRPLSYERFKAEPSLRKKIQIIFQDPFSSLNPRHTVGEIMIEPMLLHRIAGNRKEAEQKAAALLDRVGLPSSALDRYPYEFSGGQRQRICVARTIALEPEIVICDESVSALDVSVQAQVLNLLNELKEEFELTFLFISHDLSVVQYMSDHLIVMKDGGIAEQGDALEIYRHPQSDYTQKLINSIPAMHPARI